MALDLVVELVGSGYAAAGTEDERAFEWPPHPARLFCALVDAAETPVHDDVLRWLEQQDPPDILASPLKEVKAGRLLEGFVPTNQLAKTGGSTLYPARTNGPSMRTWARCHPRRRTVVFRWKRDPPGDIGDGLIELCHRVGYLGRSTSPAILRPSVSAETSVPEDIATWRPTEDGQIDLSIASSGYLDDLCDAYQAEESAWEVPRRWITYGLVGAAVASAPASEGSYCDVVILRLKGRSRVNAAHTIHLTSQLRRAVRSHVNGGPTRLHGHDVDARTWQQVSFLALPFVGHEHADGHIVGFGIALPTELGTIDRRDVLRGILQVTQLNVPRFGAFRLGPVDDDARTALQARRWARKSDTWVSAIPIVLDRFPKRPGDTEDTVARACRNAGLPDPVTIETSTFPLVSGAPTLRPNQRRRRPEDPARPAVHARIQFAEPVRGPVVLGNLRHLGLGLCLPEPRRRED